MRKGRLLQLMANYDINLQYHPSKINIVLNVFIRKLMVMSYSEKELFEEMRFLELKVILQESKVQLMTL